MLNIYLLKYIYMFPIKYVYMFPKNIYTFPIKKLLYIAYYFYLHILYHN